MFFIIVIKAYAEPFVHFYLVMPRFKIIYILVFSLSLIFCTFFLESRLLSYIGLCRLTSFRKKWVSYLINSFLLRLLLFINQLFWLLPAICIPNFTDHSLGQASCEHLFIRSLCKMKKNTIIIIFYYYYYYFYFYYYGLLFIIIIITTIIIIIITTIIITTIIIIITTTIIIIIITTIIITTIIIIIIVNTSYYYY